MKRARSIRTPEYRTDVSRILPHDDRWRARLKRREEKVLENPEHHGSHLGGLNHCKWAAPVERFFILYEIDKSTEPATVCFLAFYGPR